MVFSVVKAMDVLIWVFLVLLLFMYLFSMVFMFAASDHIANSGDRHAVVVQDFETVFESILTLYQCMTGGRDWQETYDGLAEVNTVFGLIFVGFLFFMEFLVINVVIGTVVTKTDEVSRKDKDLLVHYEMKNVREYTASIKKFFMAADADQSGQLSKEEFAQYLKDDRVKAYFQTLDLDVSQANALFDFLDRNESGEVGVQEFFDGCRRLKGAARSMDVHMALFYLEQVIEKLNKTMQASASIPVITESRKEDGKPLL
jgi:Ca2+-binding EF-hand superfamily protein